MTTAKRIAADGALVGAGIDCIIWAITLTGDGTNAGAIDVKEGGSGGTIVWSLRGPTSGDSASISFPKGIVVSDAYVDLTGTGAAASFSFEALN